MRHAILVLLLFWRFCLSSEHNAGLYTGSMQATTTTAQTIEETIAHEVYGSAVTSYSGENVTPGSNITDSSATWSITTAGDHLDARDYRTFKTGIVETIDA